MNLNLKRQALLKILCDRYKEVQVDKHRVVGVSFDDITNKLNCTREQLIIIDAPLLDEEEVGYHDFAGVEGLYIKPKGVASFGTYKYKKESERIFFDKGKNWIQLLVPILSLLITLFVVINSEIRLKNKNQELEKLEKRLKVIENQISIKKN